MQEAFPDLPRQRIDEMTAAYTTGQPYEGKEVAESITTENGVRERFLNLVIQPLRDPAGSVYGLMTHAVDVTDAVRTRQELAELALALERSNRELDSFAYAASHDLRAPLRGIANLAQWIEEDLVGSGELKAETREMLELMRGRMHRMEGSDRRPAPGTRARAARRVSPRSSQLPTSSVTSSTCCRPRTASRSRSSRICRRSRPSACCCSRYS